MGLIANLLKRKSVPDDKVDSSMQMLDNVREKCGAEVGKYLDLWEDPRNIPQPSSEPSTIEDLDERVPEDSSRYSPPLETFVYQPGSDESDPGQIADLTDTGDPIGTAVNRFFDVFAGQASSYNQNVQNQELQIGIRRPHYSGETFPESGGEPVLDACLHTEHWGIFFFGYDSNIDIYLLPYDENTPLAFKEVHTDVCQPLLSVTTREESIERQWFVDGKLLSREGLPDLAKELIGYLEHAAKERQ